MQKGLLKIVCTAILCLFLFATEARSADDVPSAEDKRSLPLAKADSLFNKKQYTQALEVYQSIFSSGQYSPAMLLRMAYIQEGLNHLGESLYYLNLYFLATDDSQALKKMEELAKKNNLQGYETDELTQALTLLQENYTSIAMALTALCLFVLSFMYVQTTRKNEKPLLSGIALLMLLAVLFVHVNYSKKAQRAIVAGSPTYLMSGPSAASSVVAIIGEGHQLQIRGKEDVWLKVTWKDGEAWVKEGGVRPIRL